ncbi:hypothetical protein E2C01_042995 [Portunus trituberculatus]|uniref:Uncharacterized protein n=1 Tax=Portunus trituberculatus TaxID=210409 RepID=A0A5B7FV49_PORTR|nr:hypothetical protein [Portunus trituberculatus]
MGRRESEAEGEAGLEHGRNLEVAMRIQLFNKAELAPQFPRIALSVLSPLPRERLVPSQTDLYFSSYRSNKGPTTSVCPWPFPPLRRHMNTYTTSKLFHMAQ